MKNNISEFYRLDELGYVSRGRSQHRPRNAPQLYGGNIPFIQTADITNSKFYITGFTQTYTQAGLDQSRLWKPGVLCIVNAGVNTGDNAILGFEACFPDSVIGFIPDQNKCEVRFVKYYLDSIKPQIRSITMGATQDNLSVAKLLTIPIPKVALKNQKKIAAILSAYDDLIENNKHRIALLEKMAEEIYREWFVRFRFPGYQTAEFEKGIPKGWKELPVADIFDYLEGPGIRNWQYTESGFPFINIRLIQDGDLNVSAANFISENEAKGKYAHFQLNAEDYVVSTSGTLGRGAVVQQHHLPLLLNTSVIRFRQKVPNTKSFMYEYLKSDLFVKQIETYATGAAQQNFGPMHLGFMKILKPTNKILEMFENICAPLYEQLTLFRKQIVNLKTTKDSLLPRLISGKLSVEDLDIQFPPSMQEDNAA